MAATGGDRFGHVQRACWVSANGSMHSRLFQSTLSGLRSRLATRRAAKAVTAAVPKSRQTRKGLRCGAIEAQTLGVPQPRAEHRVVDTVTAATPRLKVEGAQLTTKRRGRATTIRSMCESTGPKALLVARGSRGDIYRKPKWADEETAVSRMRGGEQNRGWLDSVLTKTLGADMDNA
jgi:hypothetical protein